MSKHFKHAAFRELIFFGAKEDKNKQQSELCSVHGETCCGEKEGVCVCGGLRSESRLGSRTALLRNEHMAPDLTEGKEGAT